MRLEFQKRNAFNEDAFEQIFQSICNFQFFPHRHMPEKNQWLSAFLKNQANAVFGKQNRKLLSILRSIIIFICIFYFASAGNFRLAFSHFSPEFKIRFCIVNSKFSEDFSNKTFIPDKISDALHKESKPADKRRSFVDRRS